MRSAPAVKDGADFGFDDRRTTSRVLEQLRAREATSVAILNVVFFDIGGTLGDVDPDFELHLYDDTTTILHGVRAMYLRLGVVTNVPETVDKRRVASMLANAGVVDLFEPDGVVTSTDAGCRKPALAIYRYAADALGVAVGNCVYVGEDPEQVAAAIGAGMHGVLKHRVWPRVWAASAPSPAP